MPHGHGPDLLWMLKGLWAQQKRASRNYADVDQDHGRRFGDGW